MSLGALIQDTTKSREQRVTHSKTLKKNGWRNKYRKNIVGDNGASFVESNKNRKL